MLSARHRAVTQGPPINHTSNTAGNRPRRDAAGAAESTERGSGSTDATMAPQPTRGSRGRLAPSRLISNPFGVSIW
jgi:hypothetical protein